MAPLLSAALLTATILPLWIIHHYDPALLASAGNFIWTIRSSVAELVLAVVIALLPKDR